MIQVIMCAQKYVFLQYTPNFRGFFTHKQQKRQSPDRELPFLFQFNNAN